MTLAIGSRLGAYEILGPLGAGGMGEVFRATDTNLLKDAPTPDGQKAAAPELHLVLNWAEELKAKAPAK